jgi:copper oxidase (laccase) domain-containing protein
MRRYGFTYVEALCVHGRRAGGRGRDLAAAKLEPGMSVELLRAAALDGVAHGFLGRRGGVSAKGVCSGLNVGWGSGDDREAIAENRRRAVGAVAPGAALVTVHQVHSGEALIVRPRPGRTITGRAPMRWRPTGRASRSASSPPIARRPARRPGGGRDRRRPCRLERRVRRDRRVDSEGDGRLGADRARIAAAIGPCIARRSYEVDEDFLRRFTEAEPANERFFTDGARPDRRLFDLEAYVLSRLADAGLSRIEALGEDTYGQPDRFFSFRRATHRGEPDYGRQLSLIAL